VFYKGEKNTNKGNLIAALEALAKKQLLEKGHESK